MWIVLVALHLAVASGCNPFQYEKYEIDEKGGGQKIATLKAPEAKRSLFPHIVKEPKKRGEERTSSFLEFLKGYFYRLNVRRLVSQEISQQQFFEGKAVVEFSFWEYIQ